jgi:hypothetical protein
MAVKDSKKANLWPLNVDVGLIFWLEDIQNDGYSILVIVSDDSLVSVRCIRLYDATLLLRGLRWLMILQLDRLGVQWRRVLSEQQSLHLHELDVGVLVLL